MTDARKVCQSSAAPSAPAAEPPQDVANDIHNLNYIVEHYSEVNAREIKRSCLSAAAALAAMARERDEAKERAQFYVRDRDAKLDALRADLAAARERVAELTTERANQRSLTHAMEQDAGRYRWLRHHGGSRFSWDEWRNLADLSASELDAAIDAARAGKGE